MEVVCRLKAGNWWRNEGVFGGWVFGRDSAACGLSTTNILEMGSPIFFKLGYIKINLK